MAGATRQNDSSTERILLRALATWSGAIAGLLLILVGGLIQAAAPLPGAEGSWRLVTLPITLQVPALLLTALVCGPRSAMLAAVAYLSLGLLLLSYSLAPLLPQLLLCCAVALAALLLRRLLLVES